LEMEKAVHIKIPHGFSYDGNSWLRSIYVRELNGYDERYLSESRDDLPLSAKTTELLARITILPAFDDSPIEKEPSEKSRRLFISKAPFFRNGTDLVSSMTLGDRIAILLHLRRLTYGEIMSCEINCPSCKEIVSVQISVSDILQQPPSSELQPNKSEYEVSIDSYALKLRLPNGKDQEALLSLDKGSNISHYTQHALKSLIFSACPALPDQLSIDFLAKVSSKLAELDPQSDIVFNITCPFCNYIFQAPFIVEDFIFREIASRLQLLEEEVHWLAFHYHWNEDEILSLPVRRRKRYVELINRSLSGENSTHDYY
jgi:hypothetical protein